MVPSVEAVSAVFAVLEFVAIPKLLGIDVRIGGFVEQGGHPVPPGGRGTRQEDRTARERLKRSRCDDYNNTRVPSSTTWLAGSAK